MPQEPVTKYFNLKSPHGGEELVLEALKKPSKKVIDGRKGMKGIETKSILDSEARRRDENYFRALMLGDKDFLFRAARKFDGEAKSMLAAGTMTDWEYKTLAPWVEGTPSAGGYNAPPAFAAELARNLGVYGIARKHFRQYGMKSWIENIPNLLTKPTTAWVAENGTIAASKPSEGEFVLTAEKQAAIFAASNESLEDSNIPIWATMQDIFQEQFQIKEDTVALQDDNTVCPGALWYGDGTLAASGDLTANGAIGIARGGSIASGLTGFPKIGDSAGVDDCWGDLLFMLQAQPSALYAGGKFFIDQNVLIAMMSLRDTQNRFIADIVNGITVEIGLEGQPITYFKGYEIVIVPTGIMLNANTQPYVTTTVPSTPFTFFCNPTKSWLTMGQRGGFRVDMLREGTLDAVSMAASDLQAMRMVERVAFGCALPYTMIVLRTSAT